MNKTTMLRVVLGLVCIAHLVLGGIGFFSADYAGQAASRFYGATLDMNDQLAHVVRILGAFMVAIGILAFMALRDPVRNRGIILGISMLLLMRVAQRIIYSGHVQEIFAITPAKLWTQTGFFLLLAAALLWLRPKEEGSS